MPLQNRVQPTGDIIASPLRGRYMGNRGILHSEQGELGHRRWRHKAWVCCVLSFKNRKRAVMTPGHYTELFFFDEAVALAAGHRPCAECRRADYNRFCAALNISPPISAFDSLLHQARAIPRIYGQRRHRAPLQNLPAGTFILSDDGLPQLVLRDRLVPFLSNGYSTALKRPASGEVTVLTPPPLIAALNGGYVPAHAAT